MAFTYRAVRLEDSHSVFQVFVKTIMDYSTRMGVMAVTGGNDPEVFQSPWRKRRSMFEFLAQAASHSSIFIGKPKRWT